MLTEGLDQADIAFYFTHWLTDLAGAEPSPLFGCEKFVLKFPLPVLISFIRSFGVLNELAVRTETEVFEKYLVDWWSERVPKLGPPPGAPKPAGGPGAPAATVHRRSLVLTALAVSERERGVCMSTTMCAVRAAAGAVHAGSGVGMNASNTTSGSRISSPISAVYFAQDQPFWRKLRSKLKSSSFVSSSTDTAIERELVERLASVRLVALDHNQLRTKFFAELCCPGALAARAPRHGFDGIKINRNTSKTVVLTTARAFRKIGGLS